MLKRNLILFAAILCLSFFETNGSPRALIKRNSAQGNEFSGHCAAYGMTISSDWVPYKMSDFDTPFYQFNDNGNLQYRTDIQQVLLKHKDASDTYAFAYRVVESPVAKARHWGFMGIGSCGDDWYCSSVRTTIDLPASYELCNWAPENLPMNYSGSIGISAGTGGVQFSASVNFEGQSVEISSATNVAQKHFEAFYHSTQLNDASHASMKFYGFCTFRTTTKAVSLSVKHIASYYGKEFHGVCDDTLNYTY